MEFNLYDQVIKRLNGSETTLTKRHCSSISRLSQEHINIIYLLILHHYQKKNFKSVNIPFNGKTSSNGKGVTFKLNYLSGDLQIIIGKYLDIISN